jgi:hypothetical protein
VRCNAAHARAKNRSSQRRSRTLHAWLLPQPLLTREVAELRRRGIERAKQVCAIQDGAEWIQGFVQGHRHDALRILDFAHAASYVYEMADKVRASGGHLPAKWVDGVLHRLKHEGPARVLRHVTRLARHSPQIQEQVTYLQKRRALMDYPSYRSAGWPIGLGVWRVATRGWCKLVSKGQACIGDLSTLIPCSHCVSRCSMSVGQSPGKSNIACVSSSEISRGRLVNSSVFVNSRPNGRRRNHLPHLLLQRRSRRARRLGVPRLNIGGGDRPFPLACSSKRTAQKMQRTLFPGIVSLAKG